MWVKFTQSRGHIRGVRNGWVSIWDWMFIVKDYVGRMNLNNFNHLDVCYHHNMTEGSRERHYWNAATVFNGLHEYHDFASRSKIGKPPNKLDIYIDRNDGGGAAYMFDKMTDKGPIWNNILDDRVESSPVIDNVSGYTQQKFFNALQSDVISIPLYKARLLQQNNNNQQSNVDILFQSYNY
jgi:hypothetical protein